MPGLLHHLARRVGLLTAGLVALSLLSFTAVAFFRVALLPEFGAELAMSAVELGAVTTVFALGRLVADLPGGRLADRVSALRLMGASGFSVAAGSILLGLAPGVAAVYVASFLLGIASAVANATGMTFFSSAGGPQVRGTSLAIFSAALLGGQAVGPAVAGLAAARWGWRETLVGGGVAAVAVGVLVMVRSRPLALAGGDEAAGDAGAVGAVSRRHLLLLQTVPFAVFFTLGSIPQTLVPLIGAAELGLGTDTIGIALGVGGLFRLIGTLFGGSLSDRISRKAALVPGLVLQAAGVALLVPGDMVSAWLGAIVVMSIASFAVPVAATILGDLSPPGGVGRHLGRFRFAGDIGLIAGPALVTLLYEVLGRPVAVASVAVLLLVVAAVTWRWLPETHPGRAR